MWSVYKTTAIPDIEGRTMPSISTAYPKLFRGLCPVGAVQTDLKTWAIACIAISIVTFYSWFLFPNFTKLSNPQCSTPDIAAEAAAKTPLIWKKIVKVGFFFLIKTV